MLIWALVTVELGRSGEEWSRFPFLSLKSVRLKMSGLLGGALGIKGDGASMLPRKAEGVRVRFNTLLSGVRATSSGWARIEPPQSGLAGVRRAARIDGTGGGRLESACVVCGGNAVIGWVTL